MEYTSEQDVVEYLISSNPEIVLPATEEVDIPKIATLIDSTPKESGIFSRDDIHPMVYELIFVKKYKSDWIYWETETLWWVIKDQFGEDPIPIVKNKIQSLRSLQTTDRFWRERDPFEKATLALNDIIPDFDKSEFLSPSQIAFGVDIAKHIADREYEDEVGYYVAAMCYESGLLFLPPPLSIFQEYIIKLGLYGDCSDIIEKAKKRWESLDSDKVDDLTLSDDDPIDVQIAKSIAVKEYIRIKNAQFEKQSSIIEGYK